MTVTGLINRQLKEDGRDYHFANIKNISDETSKCSHNSSIGSIVANSKIKIIPIDPGNLVGPLETRSGAIRGPDCFSPLRLNTKNEICEADQIQENSYFLDHRTDLDTIGPKPLSFEYFSICKKQNDRQEIYFPDSRSFGDSYATH